MTIAAITGTYVLHEHTFSCQIASSLELVSDTLKASDTFLTAV